MQIHVLLGFTEINQQSLVIVPPDCNFMFNEIIVKIITTINLQLLRVHLFRTFCQEMVSDYKTVLFPTEECWLAERNVLLGAVRSGMGTFLHDINNVNKDHFYHFKCTVHLSEVFNYLDDPELITAKMNYCQFFIVRMCQD